MAWSEWKKFGNSISQMVELFGYSGRPTTQTKVGTYTFTEKPNCLAFIAWHDAGYKLYLSYSINDSEIKSLGYVSNNNLTEAIFIQDEVNIGDTIMLYCYVVQSAGNGHFQLVDFK